MEAEGYSKPSKQKQKHIVVFKWKNPIKLKKSSMKSILERIEKCNTPDTPDTSIILKFTPNGALLTKDLGMEENSQPQIIVRNYMDIVSGTIHGQLDGNEE